MDKNTFTGLLLIAAIIIGFSILNAPSEEEIEAARKQRDSIEQVEAERQALREERERVAQEVQEASPEVSGVDSSITAEVIDKDSIKQNANLERFGQFAGAAMKPEEKLVVENELMKLIFSNKGGRIEKAILKNYQTYAGEELVLFDSTSSFNMNFWTYDNKEIYTDELIFTVEGDGGQLEGESEKVISYKLMVTGDQYLEYIYKIKGNDYLIDFDVNLIGMDEVINVRKGDLYIDWMVNAPNQEKSIKPQRDATTIFYKYKNEDVDDLGLGSEEKEKFETPVKWVSMKQQFFNTTLIADEYFDYSDATMQMQTDEGSTDYVKNLRATLTIPLEGERIEKFGMAMYLGPNKYSVLSEYDDDLKNIINLGWGIFGWVNKIAVIPVFNTLEKFDWSYGIIILILTVLLKLVLSPITYKTYLSGAKMRILKPEITEINEKYKDDAVKKQQAMMTLYRQTGVNPLSGCIPLLIQMPILFAMFRFFPASIELRQESFLWADDLSTYDSIYDFGFSIPFYGDHISLFTLLMAASIMVYTKFNSQMSMGAAAEGPMAAQMKIMMYMMPIMMLFFFNNYSSGLSYYYFLANVISIGQTFLIRKVFINETAIRAKIEKNKKSPKAQKKSGFQKRLEEMAKQRGVEPPKKKR